MSASAATGGSRHKVESVLARRPYDLRHACVSTWLNAGVPPAQVAEWTGHGVEVLLRVYAQVRQRDRPGGAAPDRGGAQ